MKRLLSLSLLISLFTINAFSQARYDYENIQMERLDRGVVAFRTSPDSVMVSWRYLASDRIDTYFEVYRNGKKIANVMRDHGTYFMDYNPSPKRAKYKVKAKAPVWPIKEGEGEWVLPANASVGYIDIPLHRPMGYKDVDGREVRYTASDASVADLDGDGQYEIILKWEPSNS
jgi:rhamnogalacturonan endolyase